MSTIGALQSELDALNAERARVERELRTKAADLRRLRDAAYIEAVRRRDAIGRAAIDNATQQIVVVFDPRLLDSETVEILAHMGTPVLPLAELYPKGLTFAHKGVV